MEDNRFFLQPESLEPFIRKLDVADLEERIRAEVLPDEVAVTLNRSDKAAWSVTPEGTPDRNNVLFSLAIGKHITDNAFQWKPFPNIRILGVVTHPGLIIVTLYGNDCIAKLVIRIEENHLFDVDYFVSRSSRLVDPWKSCIEITFGPLCGRDPASYDIATLWARLTRSCDRFAIGLTRKSQPPRVEDRAGPSDEMTRSKKQTDPRIPKPTEVRRSRSSPQSAVPVAGGSSSQCGTTTRSTASAARSEATDPVPPTPAATVAGAGPSVTGRTPNVKVKASKSKMTRPALVPPSTSLLSQPGLDEDEDDTAPGPSSQGPSMEETPIQNPQEEHQPEGENQTPSTAVMRGSMPGRVDDVRHIIRPTPPRPPKVCLVSEKEWSANPKDRALDPSVEIPEDLETEVGSFTTSKKSEDRKAELRKRSLLNEKFNRESDYMYIFGRDQIFELALGHMEPSDHRSRRIYRDFEKKGAEDLQRDLILHNYTKPVLTVMSNLDRRPTDWADCVNAGTFKIINGQHTWHAARELLNDAVMREENPRLQDMKVWDVQVVWTDKVSHLHALSYKCNEGHNESKHLTSLPKAIVHYRVLWEQAGKPPLFRKNASTRRKKDEGDDETVDLNLKAKYEAFRVRACQSLSATVKQEQPDKPIRIDWEKRGERSIIMASDEVWAKWELVFSKYESGSLIDLDTMAEIS